MVKTIQIPQVWKSSLYMYLSLSLSISTHECQLYWYTDPQSGPTFSQVSSKPLPLPVATSFLMILRIVQDFVGIIYAIDAMASIMGVVIYHKALKDYPFIAMIFSAQLLYGASGMLDLVFILRWNLALGVPDYLFVIVEECMSRVISRIRWMPMMVLSSQLCPVGIEGTFFSLLMCIDSLGEVSSKWGEGWCCICCK